MRSGKNVVGDHICSRLGFRTASFAKPVKDIFCKAFVVDLEFLEEWKVNNQPPPKFKKTVRQGLQFIGDGFREIYPDVWVDYAFANSSPKSCFTDGRYLNELKSVRAAGGMNILIWRPTHENNDSNESEAQIKRVVDWFVSQGTRDGMVDCSGKECPPGCEMVDFFLVNDGTLLDLYRKVDEIVIPVVQA
jgi:hypothetical protein